jgi:riboflavin transporter FmnP
LHSVAKALLQRRKKQMSRTQNENVRVNAQTDAALAAKIGPQTAGGTAERTKRLTTVAMLSAVAYILTFVSHVIPAVAGFLQYDSSDIVTVVGGFLFGPLTALLIAVVVSFVEFITISDTGLIGLVMNVISTASFVCVAAFIYKRKQTLSGAVIGLVGGVVAMTAMMLLWNYIITPLYMVSVSRAQVAAMLVPIFLPFNLLKGAINASVTLLLYKPLVTALRRARLIPAARKAGEEGPSAEASQGPKRALHKAMAIPAAVVLLTCLLVLLAWAGVI